MPDRQVFTGDRQVIRDVMMINKLHAAFVLSMIFLAVPVFAINYTSNIFHNNQTSLNVSISSTRNITTYVNVPINANITSALMNITNSTLSKQLNISSLFTYSGTFVIGDPAYYAYDSNWNTRLFTFTSYERYGYFNYTYDNIGFPSNIEIIFKASYGCGLTKSIYVYNISSGNYVLIWSDVSTGSVGDSIYQPVNITSSDFINNSVKISYYLHLPASAGCGVSFYESAFNMSYNLVKNLSMDTIGDNTIEWNNTGLLNGTSEAILNTTAMQNYISSCDPDIYGNCSVPITFSADDSGTIILSALQLNYTDNIINSSVSPNERIVSMPLDYSDTFSISITNNGYWAKAFTLGCEGMLCDNFSVTNNLANNVTNTVTYGNSTSILVTVNPRDSDVYAGLWTGNISINGSGKVNQIILTYTLGASSSGFSGIIGGGGGGGIEYIKPNCTEGFVVYFNPLKNQYECLPSNVPIMEAESFLTDTPVIAGLSIFSTMLTLLTIYFIYSFIKTRKIIYVIGIGAMLLLMFVTIEGTILYTQVNNTFNEIGNQAASVIP